MTDYISREAAFKEFAEFVRGSNNSDFLDAPTWNDAVSLIGSLPAADVAPARHGYWDSDGHTVACSNCHTLNLHQRAWEYCPYCGAKMDGGDHDAAD